MTLPAVLDRLRKRAESNPALIETLQHLAVIEQLDDPFDIPHDDVAKLAGTIGAATATLRTLELGLVRPTARRFDPPSGRLRRQ